MKSDCSEEDSNAPEKAASKSLPAIASPEDVKRLSEEQLSDLAQSVRDVLIEALSKTGDILGPTWGSSN